MIIKQITKLFLQSSSDEVEDYVDDEMFKEAKKYSDYLGMLARTVFCGISSAYLYETWTQNTDNYALLVCSGFFFILGAVMYVYFLDTTVVGLKKATRSLPNTPTINSISTILQLMFHALIIYALFYGIIELISKIK